MKKAINFFRSMKFGMLLLVLVIVCSFAGSLIVQQREPMEYVNRYGADAAKVILALGLDDVFSAPYFIVLMAALCVNLTLCSVARLPAVLGASARLRAQALAAPAKQALTAGQAQKLGAHLRRSRFRCEEKDGQLLYVKHPVGFWGALLVHLSFLLILIVGVAAVLTAQVKDETVMPGDTLTLENGARVTVESFRIEDETGTLDYASQLTAVSADGQRQVSRLVRVNEPLSFEGCKIYQQTYGTAGQLRIDRASNGSSEVLTLTEPCFLTLNGRDGVFFQALYPGYVRSEDGSVTLITSTSGAYTDPVYDLLSVAGGMTTPVLAFPGETLTIGEVSFTMLDPVSYPGLRIKRIHPAVLGALYAVFVLMIAALYICFFMPPVAVRLSPDGYAVVSPKTQTGLLLEIEALLKEDT